jgi:hypothetical protein
MMSIIHGTSLLPAVEASGFDLSLFVFLVNQYILCYLTYAVGHETFSLFL